ncbi:hypothetical protein CTAYLR_008998 [Chrysophaeum taylorii]|uniref:BTB domain-containing protein n=1 Tax=Chrysophaeum taylorii TaxID=2483200 RepID=A0AAD7ULE2_9STRA|nr:hypothetical protein CTAYLR_008998 [Chrysophaeum taylorii]
MDRIVLNSDRAGDNLVISQDGSTATQTGHTQNFEGAWVLGSGGLSRGRWVCEFKVKRRKRWMAVGYALDNLKLNRPINRTNIFVYASTGSIKANDHTRDLETGDEDGDAAQETNSAWSSFGSQYKTNDVIRAHLDMDLGVLGFSLNENADADDAGSLEPDEAVVKDAYVRLRGLTLYPAIYISGQGDTVEFKCHRVMDPIENPSFLEYLDSDQGDDLGADRVTFVVDGKKIRAHKFVLTARSQYFKTMINNHQRQHKSRTNQNDPGSSTEIAIRGADYKTFTTVLRFIYSGGDADEIPSDSIVDVFKLASEYALRPLALRCLEYMTESVTVDNALSLFSLCETHLPLTEQLKKRCVEVIRDNVKVISASPSFNELCTHPGLVKALVVPLCSPPAKRQRTQQPTNNANHDND